MVCLPLIVVLPTTFFASTAMDEFDMDVLNVTPGSTKAWCLAVSIGGPSVYALYFGLRLCHGAVPNPLKRAFVPTIAWVLTTLAAPILVLNLQDRDVLEFDPRNGNETYGYIVGGVEYAFLFV